MRAFGYVASHRLLALHVVLLYIVADVEKLVVPIVNYCLLHLVKLQALIKMSKTQPRVSPPPPMSRALCNGSNHGRAVPLTPPSTVSQRR